MDLDYKTYEWVSYFYENNNQIATFVTDEEVKNFSICKT